MKIIDCVNMFCPSCIWQIQSERVYCLSNKRPPVNVFSANFMKAAAKAIAENNIDALKKLIPKIENKNGVSLFFMVFLFHSSTSTSLPSLYRRKP